MDFDDAYANGAYIDKADEYPVKWARRAQAFRDNARCQLDVPYGPSARNRIDFFYPKSTPLGTVIFVHGGYWRAFDKSTWSHLAAGAVARGWAVAMPSYSLCPSVRITQITGQVRDAVFCVSSWIKGPIRLAGHSAGGHLVARMLDNRRPAAWRDRIESVLPISPLADLAPLMKTKMNADLKIDQAEADVESPIFQPVPTTRTSIWVGAKERPAFLGQARLLSNTWSCPLTEMADAHHFSVIDALADPDSEMVTDLLA